MSNEITIRLPDERRRTFEDHEGWTLQHLVNAHEAREPYAFHRKSFVRFIKRASGAVIVSCAPLPATHAAAATNAALFRRDNLIVETRLQFDLAWKTFIETHHADIALLLSTLEPQGGVQ